MNAKVAVFAIASAVLGGRGLAVAQSVEAQLFAPTDGKNEELSKSSLVGFWKGSLENKTGNLNAWSVQFEVHFGGDGKFESRKYTASPSIFDDSLVRRKDHWKGEWKVSGDTLVLHIETCLMAAGGPTAEACGYLAETDSMMVYKAGIPMALNVENQAAQFSIPSLSSAPVPGKDLSWGLSLGKSSVVYPEPSLGADAKSLRRAGALANVVSTN